MPRQISYKQAVSTQLMFDSHAALNRKKWFLHGAFLRG
jgi:hypothetical protein